MNWHKLEVTEARPGDSNVIVYRLEGTLTSSEESYHFLDQVRHAVQRQPTKVVCNLERISHLTSGGVGILAACYTSVTRAGGRMCLTGVPEQVRVILNIVHLLEVIGERPTEEEAIEALSRG